MPIPGRAGLVIGLVIISGYQAVRRLLLLLLLPEFWITSQLRRWGRRPLPGAYAFGDFIGWTIKASRWLMWGAVVVVSVGIITWYTRPSIGDTTLTLYIDRGIAWWYSLEGWVLTNEWAPLDRAPSVIERGSTSPVTSGDAVTPRATVVPRTTATPAPGPRRTPTATGAHQIYVVKPDDSLSKIAKRFGVTVEDLIEANKARYPSLATDRSTIGIGWELRIPKR